MPEVRRWLLVVFVVALVAAAAAMLAPMARGLGFVVRAADMQGTTRKIADLTAGAIAEHGLDIPLASGRVRARLYEPVRGHRRVALLVSGLHPAGIDEPRLVSLARQLAASGLAVVTPDLPQLSTFEISPAITDEIESAAAWLATASGLAPDGRVGLIGISFSGGLAVVAAGRPALRDRVAYVLSFGGHDDLPRVLRYLCTGLEPLPSKQVLQAEEMFARTPHDYGVAVILLGVADRAVPPKQVEPLKAAVRRFLWASHLDRVDKPKAQEEFAALVDLAGRMPEPSRTLMTYVNHRDVIHLGARLLPFIGAYGSAPALSPSKSPKPTAPIFALHGTGDNVIPPLESEYLADDLRGHAPVRLLISGLISHAEADQPVHVPDVLALGSFWGDVLGR